jgi:hypothetical protein
MNFIESAFFGVAGKQTQKAHRFLPKHNRKTSRRYAHIAHKMVCSPHTTALNRTGLRKNTEARNSRRWASYSPNAPLDARRGLHDTCYTPAILEYIKKEYNHSHPKADHILTTDPAKIWLELDKRLSHCNKEDCWLNQIRNENLRKKIDRYVFAPDKPYEWKHNPTEWLSNYDILNVLEQYELVYPNFEFIGPTPIDFDTRLKKAKNPYDIGNETKPRSGKKCIWNDLCNFSVAEKLRQKKMKIGVVFNLDKHDQGGSHWVSLFVDLSRKMMFYFDSAGGKLPGEIRKLMDRIHEQTRALGFTLKELTNGQWTHQRGNTECGMYSLFFIITMLTGKFTPSSRKLPFKKVLHIFMRDRIPDKVMEHYRDEYFNN